VLPSGDTTLLLHDSVIALVNADREPELRNVFA
jgi:hypothetical protein